MEVKNLEVLYNNLGEELELISNGFTPISLGKRIMRVETAAIYVASIINFCNM